MNILLASHGFPPTHSAGAERRAERMAKWLNSQGHQVVVFTVERVNDPHERMETTEQDGFIVHRLYFDLSTVGSGEPFHNFYDNPFVRETLEFVIGSEQFDLVHIVCGYLLGVPAIEVSKQFGLPLAITLTEFWFMCTRLNLIQMTGALCSGPESVHKCTRCLLEDKRRYRLPAQNIPALMDMFWPVSHQIGLTADMQRMVIDRQTRLKHALEMVDLVICPSQFLIDKFKEFGFNTERFIHIRQGLVAPVSQEENRPQWQMQDTPLQFTYVGQIKYHKGVDILIEAFIDLLKINPDIRLELWGNETESPDYVNRLKQRSKQYPAIHWNGPFIGNKIWDILRQTDALIVPSRWYENSPNAILEAFSMGVPVITTNLGGMAELVKHEQNGLLFELDRPDDLRTQLNRLVQDQTLLPRLREGIPKIKTLNQEMTDMLEEYHQLIANGV